MFVSLFGHFSAGLSMVPVRAKPYYGCVTIAWLQGHGKSAPLNDWHRWETPRRFFNLSTFNISCAGSVFYVTVNNINGYQELAAHTGYLFNTQAEQVLCEAWNRTNSESALYRPIYFGVETYAVTKPRSSAPCHCVSIEIVFTVQPLCEDYHSKDQSALIPQPWA